MAVFSNSRWRAAAIVHRMDILLTGATGKVGSRLARRLAQAGHAVRAMVRDTNRAGRLAGPGIVLVEGDLMRPGTLDTAVRGVDAVVHCAAFFRGATPGQAHAINHQGTRHLAEAAPAHRIYNVTDDEAPDLAALFAAVGQPPPDGSDPERARAFAAVLDGRRLCDDLGFRPLYPRLADAVAAGQA